MSLLARSVATLEGIALAGDPNYQMVAQAYPFVVRKVLRNESSSSTAILRDILFDADGQIKPTRLSTLLNAAFGFVSEAQGGFVDFDSVPDDGATLTDAVAFLLSEVRVLSCRCHPDHALEFIMSQLIRRKLHAKADLGCRSLALSISDCWYVCRRHENCGPCSLAI
jgi:hypothetical protein